MINAYKSGDGQFVVSQNRVWIPGVYETADAATLAAEKLSNDDIIAFLEHIYSFEGENRSATLDDVETAIAAVRLADMDNK